MRIGLDFGTTNSGAAVFDGQQVRIFPQPPDNIRIVFALIEKLLSHEISANHANKGTTVLDLQGGINHLPPVSFSANQMGLVDFNIIKENGVLNRLGTGRRWLAEFIESARSELIKWLDGNAR